MATVNGVIYTAVAATGPYAGSGNPGDNWKTAGYIDGRTKNQLDFYVCLGTETAGTVILMGGLLPVGAKVLEIVIGMSASTGSLTMSVGDLDSATRYASASTGPATVGMSRFNGGIDSTNGFYVIGTNPATPTTTDNDRQLKLTTGGATLAVGTIITSRVVYTTD